MPAPRETICTFRRACICVVGAGVNGIVGCTVEGDSDDSVVGRDVSRWVLMKSRTSLSMDVVRTYVP